MPKLFGIDIAGLVARELGKGLLPATLVKVVPGARTAGDLAGGTHPVETSYACRGMRDTLRKVRADSIVEDATALVLILGGTLQVGVVPAVSDRVVVEGVSHRILHVDRDPAAATYTCQVA